MWRFFDARTYRSGEFDQEYLIGLMEQLLVTSPIQFPRAVAGDILISISPSLLIENGTKGRCLVSSKKDSELPAKPKTGFSRRGFIGGVGLGGGALGTGLLENEATAAPPGQSRARARSRSPSTSTANPSS